MKGRNPTIPLGSALGVLGGGQLGQMFAIAARKLGFKVHVYSDEAECPAKELSDRFFYGSYTDQVKIKEFVSSVAAVTIEFENIPVHTLEVIEHEVPVRPSSHVLKTAQNRVREKQFFNSLGIATAPFVVCKGKNDVKSALQNFPLPAVLKTTSMGYDGKGQWKVTDRQDIPETLPEAEFILEGFVPIQKEVSILVCRNAKGEMVFWDVVENSHTRHILDVSVVPADVTPSIKETVRKHAEKIALALDLQGVLCVEFFISTNGELLANEMAPRPHNSGHWTIDAAKTSQFEAQVQALASLPLGSTELKTPFIAMGNLLGELWKTKEPDWTTIRNTDGAYLHLYGKKEARLGRKMGHLTVVGNSRLEVLTKLDVLRGR